MQALFVQKSERISTHLEHSPRDLMARSRSRFGEPANACHGAELQAHLGGK